MSNDNIWSADDDSDNDGSPKALRDHAKNLEKQLKEALSKLEKASDQISELTQARDKATLETLVKDIPPKVTKWMKRDFAADNIEPSKEAVDKWLSENGEDFGYKPGQPEKPADDQGSQTPQGSELPPDVQAAYQAIQAFEQGRTSDGSRVDEQIAELGNRNDASFDELVSQLRQMGAPVVAYGT